MVAAGTTAASGSGSMTPIPTAAATLGPYVIATPSTAALELAYAPPPAEAVADDQLVTSSLPLVSAAATPP